MVELMFILSASLLCSLPWFWLRLAGWLTCWERARIYPALRVCCRKNVLLSFCGVFSLPPCVYVGALIASIPGPSILTLKRILVQRLHPGVAPGCKYCT